MKDLLSWNGSTGIEMDEYHVNAADILSALSVSEAKGIGHFKSLIPMPGSSSIPRDMKSFQQISSIPHSVQQTEPEKTRTINGCKLHLINSEYKNVESLPILGGKGESSCNSTGTESALCAEYQRPRSQSMGLVITPDTFQTSRSHSRDSLASSGSVVDEFQTPSKSESTEETLVEVTCNKFKRLSTRGSESPKSLSPVSQNEDVKSCSRSPPIYEKEVGRKYSFGSQLSSAKRQLSSQENPISPLPIDLTCKRKKSDATSTSLYCLSICADKARNASQLGQTNADFEDGSREDQSILKSVLVGMARKRSHTLSVCSRRDFKNSNNREVGFSGFSLRQRVTLAKRNLGPVMRRMSEHLNRITQFLGSLPDFMKLSSNDQSTLISDSVHRLLMLCMAESNLQFVVTPVRDEEEASAEDGTAVEEPTMQFTETVQNYISKCQAMNISSREYSYMKIITLFHAGMYKC